MAVSNFHAGIRSLTEMTIFPPIAFNGRFLDQQMTGVQRYSHGMLTHLGPRLQVLRPEGPLPPVRGHLWEQFVLPRLSGKSLLWSPGNTGPLSRANQVVTVHDASSLEHPEWFSGPFATWYRFVVPRLMRRVRKVITVSEFSKERLLAISGIPEENIAVIPNAIDTRFKPATQEALAAFRKKHNLEQPYCLYMGSLEPRKNVLTLLKTWTDLALSDCDLILAGTPGHVFRARGFAELPPRTRLFGRVSDDELPLLLSAAKCFIFPSLYEGFGFPPLEAMACGCPVICSGTTSLPEVCGPAFDPADSQSTGAALYFSPMDREQLAAQIRAVMGMSPETSCRMSNNGLLQASKFNWERCAGQTWSVLKELIPV
jgi:glycosyltransferase involved in cell wall biosynthesis